MRVACLALVAAAIACGLIQPAPASACGGFFCRQQPVDQQAERIIFALGASGTRMIVQLAYTGRPEDFAWVLPVPEVPDRDSLGTFPAAAIQALDVNTAPVFARPADPECNEILLDGGGSEATTPGVTVHIEEVVGPYEVAVIEGATADPLFTWLEDHDYRLGAAMRPVIAGYVSEGMKLVALRLGPDAETGDIEPFEMTFPSGAPSIPIRLTAIAAEPEMGLLVFLFADERWGPANWSDLEIDPATLLWGSYAWPAETNWLTRVAQDADADGGRAWVTEMAGPTAELAETVRAVVPMDPDQVAARDALLDLLSGHPYLTRLYARLSPDEMTLDPIFSPRGGPDVPRMRQLARYVEGRDRCLDRDVDPCQYTACGPGATCTMVTTSSADYRVYLPGCTCADGTAARTTLDPRSQVVVACQRLTSFLTPAEIGGDPCAGFDCGRGTCLPINGTPTCDCEAGTVAVGFVREGERRTLCVDPAAVLSGDILGDPEPPRRLDAGSGPPPAPDAAGPTGFSPGGGGCGCSAPGRPARTSSVPFLGLGVLGLLLARRRGAC